MEARRLPILQRKLEFQRCFSKTNALAPISGKKHLDRWILSHENSRTNDAVKDNFLWRWQLQRGKKQQQGKYIQKYYTHFMHLHVLYPPNSLGSDKLCFWVCLQHSNVNHACIIKFFCRFRFFICTRFTVRAATLVCFVICISGRKYEWNFSPVRVWRIREPTKPARSWNCGRYRYVMIF